MTTFIDGPAKGKSLALRRAVKFLRVVADHHGKIDALDQPTDRPEETERIWAYQIIDPPTMAHYRMADRKASGFYAMASYRICKEQPDQEIMRGARSWEWWCGTQQDPCPEWKL